MPGFVNNVNPIRTTPSQFILAQSFTVNSSFELRTIEFAYRTTGGGTYSLSLFETSAATAATLTPVGSPLINAAQFSLGSASSNHNNPSGTTDHSVLALGVQANVTLQAGNSYAVELTHVSGSDMALLRSGANTYADGAGYQNGSLVAGVDRDWSFAFSSEDTRVIPEPGVGLLIAWGVLLLARLRKS